jgi:hypothetical protein
MSALRERTHGFRAIHDEVENQLLRRDTTHLWGARSAQLFFLFFAPAVLFLVSVIASIAAKRIFLPLIECVVDRSNEVRYTAL